MRQSSLNFSQEITRQSIKWTYFNLTVLKLTYLNLTDPKWDVLQSNRSEVDVLNKSDSPKWDVHKLNRSEVSLHLTGLSGTYLKNDQSEVGHKNDRSKVGPT